MVGYLLFPFDFLRFWYFTAPKEMLLFFFSCNNAFLQTFSLPLCLRTFFKPVKNEYRKGLVAFSIGMGMFLKTWIIIVDLLILMIIVSAEIAVIGAFLLWPVATLWLLFM